MPLDDEIIEENLTDIPADTPDNPVGDPVDSADPEVGNDSLVQDEIDSGSSTPDLEQTEPDEVPEIPEVPETDSGDSFPEQNTEQEDSLPEDEISPDEESGTEEVIITYSTEPVEIYTDLEAFESSTIQVDLYQYTILNRLEFIQYALCIVIALLFLQIFVRYKK